MILLFLNPEEAERYKEALEAAAKALPCIAGDLYALQGKINDAATDADIAHLHDPFEPD